MNKQRILISRRNFLKRVAAISGGLAASPFMVDKVLSAPIRQEVASVGPITILINDSPWFAGFEALVDMYVEQTGNEVNLDVTPFNGMLQKSRDAVQTSESDYDLLNLNEQWYGQFYRGGLVVPINDIDPDFELDPNIIEYDYSTRWDESIDYSGPDGILYGLPINGNIQLFFYRSDLFEENGLSAPTTWDEVASNAEALHNPPDMHGFTLRTNPPNWQFQAYLAGFGTSLVDVDLETGVWAVGLERPEALEALNTWISLGTNYGPENLADLGQAENIALMNSGRLAQGHMVGAAAPNFADPNQSTVVGNVAASPVPGASAGQKTMSGIWVMGIPTNLPAERQAAGLEFLKWALTKDNQNAYALAGAIPVRQDTYEELSDDPELGWWASAFAASTPFIVGQPRLPEAPQMFEVLDRITVQALIGDMTPEEAMTQAAAEVRGILEDGGYEIADV
jgi:multiple sugar transport system substrate-binding protein